MPEANEFSLMVEEVGPEVQNMEVDQIKALGKPYLQPSLQKEHLSRVEKIPTSFTITELQNRGKEFNISTQSDLTFRITFGQGAYLYYLKDLRLLEFEPFKSEAFLGFFSSKAKAAFLIMDVRTFRHQACIQVFNDRLPHWSNEKGSNVEPIVTIGRYPKTKKAARIVPTLRIARVQNKKNKKSYKKVFQKTAPVKETATKKPQNVLRGPCIITQHEKFKEAFLRKFSSNPLYFQSHTLAYIMFDDELCYGFGEYSVSELLCRFYLSYGVKPWDSAYKALLGVPGFLEGFLEGPKTFYEEYKLYRKDYDPALYRKAQEKARTEFRLNFRLVYGKSIFKDKQIISFFFKQRKKETKKSKGNNSVKTVRNNRLNTKSVWAFCLEADEIPNEISARGNKEEEDTESQGKEEPKKPAHLQDYSQFVKIDPEIDEDWFRYNGRIITKDTIGVGPHDWHVPHIAKQFAINKEDFDVEKHKDPIKIVTNNREKKKRIKLTFVEVLEKRKKKAEFKEPPKSWKRGGKRISSRKEKNLFRFGEKYKTDIKIDFSPRNAYLKSMRNLS